MNLGNSKAHSFSIVLIGNFSPCMFQPYWFKYCGILSENEFNTVNCDVNKENVIVTNAITSFETDTFVFRVEPNKFIIIAKKEPFELLLDIFSKLKENLNSILIEKFGMNYAFHIELDTPEKFKRFGDVLAPKFYWQDFFKDSEDDINNKSGLSMMAMRKVTDFGGINVKVEPSLCFSNAVFFDFNFHFERNSKEFYLISDVDEIIRKRFQEYNDYSNYVSKKLVRSVFDNE